MRAPAAERNVDAICEMLTTYAPKTGQALEIASGTGQHISTFASAMPDLAWHPSEIDPARRRSIDAYVQEAALTNVAPAVPLNATKLGWGRQHTPKDLVLLINLLHLISAQETLILIAEASQCLAPGGRLIIYGPFSRNETLASEADQQFDAQLRTADPNIGYKDTVDIALWLKQADLVLEHEVNMPANNLTFIARKPV